MPIKKKLFLVSQDPQTIQAVGESATNGSPIEVDVVLPDAAAMETYLKRSGGAAGIYDIDPDSTRSLSRLELLLAACPDTCVIVTSQEMTQELILLAMRCLSELSDLALVVFQMTLKSGRGRANALNERNDAVGGSRRKTR